MCTQPYSNYLTDPKIEHILQERSPGVITRGAPIIGWLSEKIPSLSVIGSDCLTALTLVINAHV